MIKEAHISYALTCIHRAPRTTPHRRAAASNGPVFSPADMHRTLRIHRIYRKRICFIRSPTKFIITHSPASLSMIQHLCYPCHHELAALELPDARNDFLTIGGRRAPSLARRTPVLHPLILQYYITRNNIYTSRTPILRTRDYTPYQVPHSALSSRSHIVFRANGPYAYSSPDL